MSELSYLEKLLDGVKVEWLPLGNLTKYEQPTKYLVKTKNYDDSYETPVLTAGKSFILGYTDEKNGLYRGSISPVIIFDDFTTANKWVCFDFKVKSSAMKMITSCDENKVSLKFVYYWLNTLPSELVDGDHKRQWISNYSNKLIPIPCPNNPEKSLAIQSEIVRILDKFTALTAALTAELTAELTARKKQYNYYRDQLLSFEKENLGGHLEKFLDGIEVEWIRLGNVARIKNGKDHKSLGEGNVPVYGSGGIMRYADTYAYDKASVLIPRKGSLGNLFFVDAPFWIVDTIFYTIIDETQIRPKYFYYFLTTAGLGNMNQAGGVPSQTQSVLNEIKIPIPCPNNPEKSLAIQSEIVRILDKFDTLTNSISEGLPSEIELRKKQYEYYRDLLFSFTNSDPKAVSEDE